MPKPRRAKSNRSRFDLSMPGFDLHIDDTHDLPNLLERIAVCFPPLADFLRWLNGLSSTPLPDPVVLSLPPPDPQESVRLTDAQYAVAECIIENMTTRQIAAHLHNEPSTINSHRRAIKKAVGASDPKGLRKAKARWWRSESP